jgi:Big-like domain-containing protein
MKRLLARALSAAVITTVVSSGLIVGAGTGAQAAPPGPVPAQQQLAAEGLLDFLTDDPVLLGTGVVGEPLSLVQPVFGLLAPLLQGLITTDVTWLCDGEAIPGVGDVLEFVPTEAQAGCEMAAETVSSLLGLVPLSLVTNVIPIGAGDDLPGSLLDVLTGNPLLQGTGAVGDPLSVVAPVFGLLSPLLQGLITTDVTWLCDGEAIPGVGNVLEFVPTEAQAGCEMVAQTVSTLLGLLPLSLVTNLVNVPGGVAGAPQATTAAHVAGTPKVGQTLTITDPVWDSTGVTNTYAWVRNGVAIPGAAAKTYKVSAQDAGKQITAKVTGTKAGKSGTSVSNALLISNEAVEQLVATAAPHISGAQKVGGLMAIDPGSWLGGIVTPLFSYQWYNTSGAIPGATSREYVPTLADAGRPMAATVTATLTGFLDGLGITNVVRVAKAASKTRLSKASGRLVALRVTPGAAHPAGKVRLMQGGKTLKTYKLLAADNGRRTVRLPQLAKGTHKIRAVYLGSSALKRSTSKVLRLRVG